MKLKIKGLLIAVLVGIVAVIIFAIIKSNFFVEAILVFFIGGLGATIGNYYSNSKN
ncbi:hypothetical protein NC661_13575 [Aquibacillus koreensis]|uniref:Uncharacterized protein n=1 Tax=Aquibacillus koreensis TaxID=279446 RepID=A0A9X3WNF8_9BACI|nr:hypothetical protein [Aquibacillus koreensis]MCT2536246.1 hypothetical protein [Aquibacillus koreensis]MDC3421401.1 hypothetical protein [Aquibacillus koreensis]